MSTASTLAASGYYPAITEMASAKTRISTSGFENCRKKATGAEARRCGFGALGRTPTVAQ